MKRMLIICITMMLILSLALAAYGNNTTEVYFTVEESYELVIPSTATISSDGSGTMNIYLANSHVESVNIQLLINDNYDYGKWQLLGVKNNNKLPYVISTDGNANVQPDDLIAVSRDNSLSLTLTVDGSSLNNALADTYRDTLVFSVK